MADRRDLLKFLGAGSMASLSGCSWLVKQTGLEIPAQDGTTPPRNGDAPNRYQEIKTELKKTRETLTTEPPKFDFSYDRREFDVSRGGMTKVIGNGHPEQDGDRLKITPGEPSTSALARRL
ncbi:MAG: hypothetical protein ABEI52_01675, partial [Halobacteriaceae archaeon]